MKIDRDVRYTILMADLVMTAVRAHITADDGHTVIRYNVIVEDTPTGRSKSFLCTEAQFAATMALTVGAPLPAVTESTLYSIAEPALVGLPNEFRPIP